MKKQSYFQKQRDAILNDPYRKRLLQSLYELYANSLPMILKEDNGNIVCSSSGEVEEAADKIRELIRQRDNQIFNSMKP